MDTIITASRCPNYLNELPRHQWVIRDTLWISETEVGNGHFAFFAVAVLGDSSYLSADPLLPVVNVTWYETEPFCAWLTAQVEGIRFRLPHEVEWEYAARGSSDNPYPWGRQAIFDSLANFGGAIGRPCLISSYPSGKSLRGVLNLAGNVYEWCANGLYSYPTDSTAIAPDYAPNDEGERP
ncbi:MAG: formylglycine-generating enzyme family protein [Candidatus Oleimicrobiaceae bacterium]